MPEILDPRSAVNSRGGGVAALVSVRRMKMPLRRLTMWIPCRNPAEHARGREVRAWLVALRMPRRTSGWPRAKPSQPGLTRGRDGL